MTSTPNLPRILVIDDEMGPRESLRMLLKPEYNVATADCVEAGIKLLNREATETTIEHRRYAVPGNERGTERPAPDS